MGAVELKQTVLELKGSTVVSPVANSAQRIRDRFQVAATVGERIADLAAVAAAALLSYWVYELLHLGKRLHYPADFVAVATSGFAVLFVLLLEHAGAYERGNSLLRIRETERILRISVQAFALVFPVTFFLGHAFSRWVLALGVVFVPLLLVLEKQAVFLLIRHLHSRGYGVQNVLVYGAGYTGRRVFSALVRSPKLGMNPVAIVDDDDSLTGQTVYEWGYKRERSVPVVQGPPTSDMVRKHAASMVVVAIPSLPRKTLSHIAAEAFAAQARVAFVPQLSFGAGILNDHADIDGVLIASLRPADSKFGYETAKRSFDLLGALALTVLTAPLWAVLAVLIRLDSPGPVFFHQKRVGRNGKIFKLYKFRSMKVDAPKYDFSPTGEGDPRVTRVGRWLRRTSLDELPQLMNVFKGEMSLVGPRPEMPFIVDQYDAIHRQRLQVTPGITGMWQLSADRAFEIHENIQYDLYYIRNRSFFMDLAILLHTLVFFMKGV